MAKSLAALTGKAIDEGFAAVGLPGFERLKVSDGISLRRWFRSDEPLQCEITVHRDKWWTRSGGFVTGEVFVLANGYQSVIGGGTQSWLEPDHSRPLKQFQYGFSNEADPFHQQIHDRTDWRHLCDTFARWLETRVGPWVHRFESDDGVLDYLGSQRAFDAEAEYASRIGQPERAARAIRAFLSDLPRNANATFARLRNSGLLDDGDAAQLEFASMQREDEYREFVETWKARKS